MAATAVMLAGDCRTVLPTLPADSVHCCVTSPPYWGLRSYLPDGHEDKHREIGLEASVAEYVAELVAVFREVRRVLRPDGTLWLNLGDAYVADGRKGRAHMGVGKNSGYSAWVNKTCDDLPSKNLIGLPWRVAFALQADGWWLRSDIIWSKPNPMPESVRDRPTRAHEYVFLLSRGAGYHFDADAVREPLAPATLGREHYGRPREAENSIGRLNRWGGDTRSGSRQSPPAGRNVRSVWTIATQSFTGSHFAVMPAALAERCILAGCPQGGLVLDPFAGAGTTLLAADRLQRRGLGIELNPAYADMAVRRVTDDAPLLAWEGTA